MDVSLLDAIVSRISNQVVGFYKQNIWKTLVEEWHFTSKHQLPGFSISGTLIENGLMENFIFCAVIPPARGGWVLNLRRTKFWLDENSCTVVLSTIPPQEINKNPKRLWTICEKSLKILLETLLFPRWSKILNNLEHVIPGSHCTQKMSFWSRISLANVINLRETVDLVTLTKGILNLCVLKAPFPYPLKTSETFRFSDVFRG